MRFRDPVPVNKHLNKLLIVLYGCETLSLILREEHRLRVFENRVLRRIFEPMRDEVIGEWRQLHNEEVHDLYSSANSFWVIKSRRIRMGRAGSMYGEKAEVHTGFLWGNLRERDHLEDPGVDGRIILRHIFRNCDKGHGLD